MCASDEPAATREDRHRDGLADRNSRAVCRHDRAHGMAAVQRSGHIADGLFGIVRRNGDGLRFWRRINDVQRAGPSRARGRRVRGERRTRGRFDYGQ